MTDKQSVRGPDLSPQDEPAKKFGAYRYDHLHNHARNN